MRAIRHRLLCRARRVRSARPDRPVVRGKAPEDPLQGGVTVGKNRHRGGLKWPDAERLARLLALLIKATAELLDALKIH